MCGDLNKTLPLLLDTSDQQAERKNLLFQGKEKTEKMKKSGMQHWKEQEMFHFHVELFKTQVVYTNWYMLKALSCGSIRDATYYCVLSLVTNYLKTVNKFWVFNDNFFPLLESEQVLQRRVDHGDVQQLNKNPSETNYKLTLAKALSSQCVWRYTLGLSDRLSPLW